MNGFIANFWRATKHQPAAVAEAADYPVSHVDLGARHRWLMEQRERLGAALQDADWPGDAKCAGWWLYGQCCWIGSGWCEWNRTGVVSEQIPHVSNAGMGVQAVGQIPQVSDPGRCIQAVGQVLGKHDGFLTSAGKVAWVWLRRLAARLERVRILHGDWTRCLNHYYGGENTAVFLDPPYRRYEALYGAGGKGTADTVAEWAKANVGLRIALCGLAGDYDMPGWDEVAWERDRLTYSGGETTDQERVWFSPACLPGERYEQGELFAEE
jgi:hypothetical protein